MAKLRMKPLVAYSCPPTRTEGFDLQKAQPMEDDDEGEEQKAQPNEDDDDDEGEEQKAQPNEEDKKGWNVDFGNPHVSCLNESKQTSLSNLMIVNFQNRRDYKIAFITTIESYSL